MKVVRIIGPSGGDLAVSEVVVEIAGTMVSFLRSANGGEPRRVERRWASLQEALSRTTRIVTTAEIVDVNVLDEARAMVT